MEIFELMMSNEINLEQLNSLSPEERALALEILKEYSQEGYSTLLDELKYSDFEEIPVDIMTFISDERYLGRGLYTVDEFTGERKCTVFPYWIEKLKEIFPDNLTTQYNTVILTGSIGLGKSFIAVVCQLYLLYRMLCLKDPYTYYGLQPIDKITFGSTELMDVLRGEGEIESITFVGLCTDICVISNAMLAKANFPEVPLTVDAKGCAGVTPESHARALEAMKICQIKISNY